MSTYYVIGCHDCRKMWDLTGYGRGMVERFGGEFLIEHIDCNVSLTNDLQFVAEEGEGIFEDVYEKVRNYKEEPPLDPFRSRMDVAILIGDEKKITLKNVTSNFIQEIEFIVLNAGHKTLRTVRLEHGNQFLSNREEIPIPKEAVE